MPILRPYPLIAIASALPRDTLRNIRSTGEFAVNVMGKPAFREAMKCAKDYPPEINDLYVQDDKLTELPVSLLLRYLRSLGASIAGRDELDGGCVTTPLHDGRLQDLLGKPGRASWRSRPVP